MSKQIRTMEKPSLELALDKYYEKFNHLPVGGDTPVVNDGGDGQDGGTGAVQEQAGDGVVRTEDIGGTVEDLLILK